MTTTNVSCLEVPALGAGGTSQPGRYPQNRAPLASLRLLKLPLGAVRPDGWLRHQLELMADGMVGRLTELSDFLAPGNGWFGGANPGWEEQPYWLRGFYPLGVLAENARIADESLRWIDAVLSSGQPDGYFGAPFHKAVAGGGGQVLADLWPHMVMLDALIQHYEHTGDDRVPDLMLRFFGWCRDLPEERFIPRLSGARFEEWRQQEFGEARIGVQVKRAGDMLAHLYWLYNRTGEAWLLPLATRFCDRILPPVSEWLDDHVVNFAQRWAYPAIYGQQTDLDWGLKRAEYWYRHHTSVWGQQPRGIFAADERIRPGKVDPRQAFETCAMVELAKQFYQLGRLSGHVLYADRAEDLMLNHFPAAQMANLRGLHYLTASNQPQLDAGAAHDHYNKGFMLPYSPHRYRCCQHNVAMGWPWYVENLWQATPDGGLALWLYGASQVTAKVGEGEATLREETEYPFRDSAAVTVMATSGGRFPLYLRAPTWCRQMAIRLNGRDVEAAPAAGSYVRLERAWRPGDRIELRLPMSVSLTRWPRNDSVTLERGPLSYSVRIEERWQRCGGTEAWPEWEVFPRSPWAWAPLVAAGEPVAVEVAERAFPAQPWTADGAPVEIRLAAKRVPGWRVDDNGTVGEVPPHQQLQDQATEPIRMIPLGCARLRMSCLPMAAPCVAASHE